VSRRRRGIGCSVHTSGGAVGSPGGDRYGVGATGSPPQEGEKRPS
jgi:hypothetical protein